MKQVFAEQSELDPLFQILVGSRDDAHIGFHRAVAADAVKTAVAEHPQQAGLQFKRHVPDFVQKKRSAIGLLEAAPSLALRAGEGTALVAK